MVATPLPDALDSRLAGHLNLLYGSEGAGRLLDSVMDRLRQHALNRPSTAGPLTEADAILISYADQLQAPDTPPLQVLGEFLTARLSGLVSGVHLLPFYPSSSDDGFSVIDYRQVDRAFGDWEDVQAIGRGFRLMFDAVINHISAHSAWFQAFAAGDPNYTQHFILVDPNTDLSQVVRPRDLPLLTPVETAHGIRHLWTTFSEDQIDLNFANPQVLLEIVDLLLFYVDQGAQLLRLDAIAFLWKKLGTSCLHLPETHEVVRLMRTILDAVAPWVLLITETNVPHAENVSYFGDGTDEAQLVYQFALPPLVLHTLTAGDASKLTHWAAELSLPSDRVTFFNFLASHDGIGLRPAAGILDAHELQALLDLTTARGGGISQRSGADGKPSPYELNINFLEALTPPDELATDLPRVATRFLLSQAIMLALQGLPGIYFHSLVGSRNDLEGVARTGRLRSINRQKLHVADLQAELGDAVALRHRVFQGYTRLLAARRSDPAFSPWATQQVVDLGPALFGILRREAGSRRRVLCLHEVAGVGGAFAAQRAVPGASGGFDLLAKEPVDLRSAELAPYQARWIALDRGPAG